jgi:hypothetical protein
MTAVRESSAVATETVTAGVNKFSNNLESASKSKHWMGDKRHVPH